MGKNCTNAYIGVFLPWHPFLAHFASKYGLNPSITFVRPALEGATKLLESHHRALHHQNWPKTQYFCSVKAATGNSKCPGTLFGTFCPIIWTIPINNFCQASPGGGYQAPRVPSQGTTPPELAKNPIILKCESYNRQQEMPRHLFLAHFASIWTKLIKNFCKASKGASPVACRSCYEAKTTKRGCRGISCCLLQLSNYEIMSFLANCGGVEPCVVTLGAW